MMLRTAPNFSNRTNRILARSSRHQTSASFAGIHTTHHSSAAASSLWGSPDESITECNRVLQLKDENVWLLLHGNAIKVHMCQAHQLITVIESGQEKERKWASLTAFSYRLQPCRFEMLPCSDAPDSNYQLVIELCWTLITRQSFEFTRNDTECIDNFCFQE